MRKIKQWIEGEMKGKGCVVVLAGSATAGRKWINYEIRKGWQDGKGVVGVHIHNLKNKDGRQSSKGRNPFSGLNVDGAALGSVVKCYDPPYSTSKYVYDHICEHIEDWVEEAIKIRNNHKK